MQISNAVEFADGGANENATSRALAAGGRVLRDGVGSKCRLLSSFTVRRRDRRRGGTTSAACAVRIAEFRLFVCVEWRRCS